MALQLMLQPSHAQDATALKSPGDCRCALQPERDQWLGSMLRGAQEGLYPLYVLFPAPGNYHSRSRTLQIG